MTGSQPSISPFLFLAVTATEMAALLHDCKKAPGIGTIDRTSLGIYGTPAEFAATHETGSGAWPTGRIRVISGVAFRSLEAIIVTSVHRLKICHFDLVARRLIRIDIRRDISKLFAYHVDGAQVSPRDFEHREDGSWLRQNGFVTMSC